MLSLSFKQHFFHSNSLKYTNETIHACEMSTVQTNKNYHMQKWHEEKGAIKSKYKLGGNETCQTLEMESKE